MPPAKTEQPVLRVRDGSSGSASRYACSCRDEIRVVVVRQVTERSCGSCIPTVCEELARGVWIWISECECQSSGTAR